jgi:hypothetical protein
MTAILCGLSVIIALPLCCCPNPMLGGLLLVCVSLPLFLTSIALAEREGWGRG